MKRVWKCDFCNHTNVSSDEIKEHEKNCDYNPIFKKCWSCEFHSPDYHERFRCNIGVGVREYEDNGNCYNWQTDDKKLIRKLKLERLKNIKI